MQILTNLTGYVVELFIILKPSSQCQIEALFYNKLNDLRCHVITMYTKVTTEKY